MRALRYALVRTNSSFALNDNQALPESTLVKLNIGFSLNPAYP